MKYTRIICTIFIILCLGFIGYFIIYPEVKVSRKIYIPDIVGLSVEDGQSRLEDLHAKYEIVYEDGNEDKKIVRTMPCADTIISEYQTVYVYVSKKKPSEVENLKGRNYDDVLSILDEYKQAGANVNILYKKDNSLEKNTIIAQYPTRGIISEKLEITLTISYIDLRISMPYFVGKNVNEALTFCATNGFKIKTIFVSSEYPKYTILFQENQHMEQLYINSGQYLTFYVAK